MKIFMQLSLAPKISLRIHTDYNHLQFSCKHIKVDTDINKEMMVYLSFELIKTNSIERKLDELTIMVIHDILKRQRRHLTLS